VSAIWDAVTARVRLVRRAAECDGNHGRLAAKVMKGPGECDERCGEGPAGVRKGTVGWRGR